MSEITEIITRRINYHDHKVWFTTNAIKSAYSGKWKNTLYINFCKDDFPKLDHPKLISWEHYSVNQTFDYPESSLAELSWHRGLTFYEEMLHIEQNKTYVKAGCDYSHYRDEDYAKADNGKIILELEAPLLLKQFLNLVLASKGSG